MRAGEQLIRRWFQKVWNDCDLAAVDEMLAKNYVTRGLKGGLGAEPNGIDTFKEFRKAFAKEFPTLRIDVEEVVEQDNRLAARCKVEVVHAKSGKKAEFGGMCFAHHKDGQIIEAWNNFDFAAMREQLT